MTNPGRGNTAFTNMTGNPSLVIPCGFFSGTPTVPIAIMFHGKPFDEFTLYRVPRRARLRIGDRLAQAAPTAGGYVACRRRLWAGKEADVCFDRRDGGRRSLSRPLWAKGRDRFDEGGAVAWDGSGGTERPRVGPPQGLFLRVLWALGELDGRL